MNERVKQLAVQATIKTSHKYHTWGDRIATETKEVFDREKFAELIVRECIKEIGYKSVELLDIDFYPHYQERLKKYFGVEEC